MKIQDVRFAHLHTHNHYSLLDGFMSQDAMIERARELDLVAVAETNHGKMYGSYSFYKKARAKTDKKGNPLKPVKPIIGVEAYVAPSHEHVYEKGQKKRYYHFILLAKNYEGYQELCRSSRASEKRTYRDRPILTDSDLEAYFGNGNIIATSACMGGEIQQHLLNGEYDKAKEKTLYYKNIFKGDFYMELQNHGIREQIGLINMQVQLAEECGIECIITSDAHFAHKEDKKYHDILICMQFGKTLRNYESKAYTPYHYMMSKGELYEMFRGILPDDKIIRALNNTGIIADKCNVEFPKENYYPKYIKLKEGENADDVLRQRAFEGLYEKKVYKLGDGNVKEEYEDRLETELGIIKKTGYSDYFLIVSDVLDDYENNVKGYAGLGRGSVVGSLVSYVTGMTKVDPIEHELYFDRFLNLERVSPPDADLDFDNKREHVFKYTMDTYGENNVCKIITFGTLAARSAIRNVGRVLDIPLSYVDRVAKAVTSSPGVTIEDCLDETSEFYSVPLKTMYDEEDMVKELLDTAIMFEGIIKNTSIHAAACIVSDNDLSNYVPLQWDKDSNMWVTQFYKDYNEELGLLKLDYLGLNNLTVIREAVDLVNKRHGLNLSHNDIIIKAQEDPRVVSEIYAKAKTKLVFQFESGGMRETLTSFNPKTLDDLILLNAVYRPGPMQYIPKIVENKNNPKDAHYDHNVLRPILEPTYGYPVYQEQIMAIFRTICGYSLGKADIIRRAMGKKKMDELEAARKDFIDGYLKLGLSADRATEFFDEIMEFAKYSFNKSHAAAYTITSLETAYLKLNYPQEYMTASLSYPPKAEAYPDMLEECRSMSIPIYIPDINKSEEMFVPENEGIRFGLAAIKDVGKGAREIVQGKPYKSFEQFIDGLRTMANVNKTKLVALARGGAFDSFGFNRRTAAENIESFLKVGRKGSKKALQGQIDLFSMGALDSSEMIEIIPFDEYPYNEKLEMEYEALFAYVSGHPLDEYRPYVATSEIQFSDITSEHHGQTFKIVARVKDFDILYRKKDSKPMLKVILEDFTENMEAMVFTNEYETVAPYITKGAVKEFIVRIDVDEEVREDDVIITKKAFIKEVHALPAINRAIIRIDREEDMNLDVLKRNPGGTEIYFYIHGKGFVSSKVFSNITDEVVYFFQEENIAVF